MEFPTWPKMELPNNTFQFQTVVKKSNYTIIASKILRPNAEYTLGLTIYDEKCEIDEPIVVRVSIKDHASEDKCDRFNINRDVTLKPNVTEMVSIFVGDLSVDRKYALIAKGISGTNLYGQASLDVQTHKYSILIQTDKAIYKPNDCVKFRVLVLDSELKAAPIDQNELSIAFNVSIYSILSLAIVERIYNVIHFIAISINCVIDNC